MPSSWDIGTGKELTPALITALRKLLLILAGDVETNPGPENGKQCIYHRKVKGRNCSAFLSHNHYISNVFGASINHPHCIQNYMVYCKDRRLRCVASSLRWNRIRAATIRFSTVWFLSDYNCNTLIFLLCITVFDATCLPLDEMPVIVSQIFPLLRLVGFAMLCTQLVIRSVQETYNHLPPYLPFSSLSTLLPLFCSPLTHPRQHLIQLSFQTQNPR